jgi:hypothetical protein
MKTRFFTLIILFFSILHTQAATFTVTYTGFTTQAQTSFEYALDIWANSITSTVPIKIAAHFEPLGATQFGQSFPNGRKNFIGAPLTDTWYPTALANALTGIELNPGEVDIELYLNSTTAWYYGTTGTGNCSQVDFVTVALHEICHGLGIASLAKMNGSTGSIGTLQASDFSPLTTSFPWPNLSSYPSAFDRMLINNLNQPLVGFTNSSNALGTQLTGDNIFITGTATLLANNGNPAKIYAPSTFSLGASISHLDETLYPVGNANELMTPYIDFCNAQHTIGPIVKAILQDLGWTFAVTTAIRPSSRVENDCRVYPNPFSDALSIKALSLGDREVVLYDITGKEMTRTLMPDCDLHFTTIHLSKGFYTLHILHNGQTEIVKLIKQ